MEIKTVHTDDLVEMQVAGMLDTNWADHLSVAIDEVIRAQSHRLLVNLKDVTYLSSAGISVLLKAHAQFQRIHGFFAVCDPSPHVRQVLHRRGALLGRAFRGEVQPRAEQVVVRLPIGLRYRLAVHPHLRRDLIPGTIDEQRSLRALQHDPVAAE